MSVKVHEKKMDRGRRSHTTLLDTLDGGIRDGSVDCLGGLLDGLSGRLLEARVGAEEAGVADDGRAEHRGGIYVD